MHHLKFRTLSIALVLTAAFCMASVSFAQSCGVPGGPACTPTPRPTSVPATAAPTTAPVVVQPTAEPTSQPTPTEAPLIPLPTTGACVAAANGNFRVNVRDWPGEDGDIIDVLSSGEVEPVMAHVKVFDGRDGSFWVATGNGGFMSEPALRFGGENCDTLPVVEFEGTNDLFLLASRDDDGSVYPLIIDFRAPDDDGATSDDDICIEYPYRDPYNPSGGGTICLPFDITSTAMYCENGHCILVDPYMEEASDEIDQLAAAPTPEPEELDGDFWVIANPGGDGSTSGDDICIEYKYMHPWGHSGTACLAANLSAGDVACFDDNCVVIVD